MIIDNIKSLLCCIAIVLVLLSVCMTIDYADDRPIKIIKNQSKYNDTSVIKVQDSKGIVAVNKSASVIIPKTSDKIHTIKPKYPTITMTGKPSCSRCARNHCSYTWRTKTYINYCPHCHHWTCLGNKHKYGSRYEQEITCFRCDSDFCVNCGKTKYSWSNVYLRRA